MLNTQMIFYNSTFKWSALAVRNLLSTIHKVSIAANKDNVWTIRLKGFWIGRKLIIEFICNVCILHSKRTTFLSLSFWTLQLVFTFHTINIFPMCLTFPFHFNSIFSSFLLFQAHFISHSTWNHASSLLYFKKK